MRPYKERQVSKVIHTLLIGNGRCTAAPAQPVVDKQVIPTNRALWYPLSIIVATWIASSLLPVIVYDYDASVALFWQEGLLSVADILSRIRLPTCNAALVFAVWCAVQAALLELVPGKVIKGPITPTGESPEYRDNGMKCWFITHIGWLILGPMTGIVNFGGLYDIWGSFISTTNAFAIPFCLFLMWKGMYYPSSRDAVWTGRPVFDFFQGVELHPRILGLNIKQLVNCRISMMGWSISQLAFAQAQYDRGQLSSGIVVCAVLHVLYLAKFFYWEAGYFASIDIIHDRCGYYIIWGVLTWVPASYCMAGFAAVERPTQWSHLTAGILFAVGIVSLVINYVADYQRQLTRSTGGNCKIWGSKPVCIDAEYTTTDGTVHKSILLCSGFWGVSRHFNYIPELCLAFAWCVPAGSLRVLPFSYFVILLILLVDRAARDDGKCSEKYGKYWVEYCKRVPYRMIPGIY